VPYDVEGKRTFLWDREDILSCKCPMLRYTHAHCPCEECEGKAVSRSTEYRHWTAAKQQLQADMQETTHSVNCRPVNSDHDVSTVPEFVNAYVDHEVNSAAEMTQCTHDVATCTCEEETYVDEQSIDEACDLERINMEMIEQEDRDSFEYTNHRACDEKHDSVTEHGHTLVATQREGEDATNGIYNVLEERSYTSSQATAGDETSNRTGN